jgi:hypothetical protein
MATSPLFVRFANGDSSVPDVCRALQSSPHEETAQAAASLLAGEAEYAYDVETFRTDFRSCLRDLMGDGITAHAQKYLDSYMACLVEDVKGDGFSQKGSTTRSVHIGDLGGPWVEGLVCYNLCLYISSEGLSQLKSCKTCRRFFVGRGKYAAYCGDACKKRGGTP